VDCLTTERLLVADRGLSMMMESCCSPSNASYFCFSISICSCYFL